MVKKFTFDYDADLTCDVVMSLKLFLSSNGLSLIGIYLEKGLETRELAKFYF